MTFAAGMAVGYVFGTRAGRGKYEQIAGKARRLLDNPTLGELQHAARDLTAASAPAVAAAPQPATVPAPPARPAKTAPKPRGRTATGTG